MRCTIIIIALIFCCINLHGQKIRVGSKHFNEGYILSEIISQLLEENGFKVERRFNLGGTLVCFEAIRNDEIDIYPEYSGTLSVEVLRQPKLSYFEINKELQSQFKLEIGKPFGFSNSYALICSDSNARKHHLKNISDLQGQKDMRLGLSYEFLRRQDGWDNLKDAYQLLQRPVALEHGLAYQALRDNKIEITDAYTTDGEISRYDLVVLKDDRNFFPAYEATTIYRQQIPPAVKIILMKLDGTINEKLMQSMNADVIFGDKSIEKIANEFLIGKNLVSVSRTTPSSPVRDILEKTLTHVELTFVALVLAIIVAIPMGITLYWNPAWANGVIYATGLLQTIPSIALLAIMIPIFGIGIVPAIVALFLYALLPILRNTLTGLRTVDPLLKRVADGIGMTRFQKLKHVEFPLAIPAIMAGIRTAAVINVGTATLAAFIGAGGLGEFIVSGLALNNTALILRGAVPAALLALVVEFAFTILERWIVPKHLKMI